MKKILSAAAAGIFACYTLSANVQELYASNLYRNSPAYDQNYYCIVELNDDPLAKYEYSQLNGTDEFIFTDEGKNVFEDLMSDHQYALDSISTALNREVEKLYDYTAVYNGFSIVLKDSEFKEVYNAKKTLGIKNIYETQYSPDNAPQDTMPIKESNDNYTDFTDTILEKVGVLNSTYKGDSMVIAVIDNEFDISHEFLSTPPENTQGRIDTEFVENISPFLSATSGNGIDYYLNEKIPFRFDYTKHTTDTSMMTGDTVNHGTHIAGIAAGNGDAETNEKYDPKGTAPNAQLVLMANNLQSQELMAAYDDCAYLGVDSINASYGSNVTPVGLEPFTSAAMLNLAGIGITFCSAAGNEGKINFKGINSLLNTDYASTGSPGGYSSALTVGSADNCNYSNYFISAADNNYQIQFGTNPINTAFPDKEMDFAVIDGLGYPEDFDGIDVKGKIAVIKRGEISFEEKAANAKANGAVGVIFYNDVIKYEPLTINCTSLPSGMISYNDGIKLINSKETKITILAEGQVTTNAISSFSSWGFTEELLLKPDITAFGKNILSSIPNGGYDFKSGTSMATPQVTGITTLLKEYLKNNKEKYGITNESDYPELIAKLLMSTASPLYDTNGLTISSPRLQGSGLINLENAIKTPAYLYTTSVKDNFRPKLSLGDNLDKNLGNLEFSINHFNFHIKNISDQPVKYTLSSDVMRDGVDEDGLTDNVVCMQESKVIFKSNLTQISEITVAPGEDTVINMDLHISLDDNNLIANSFKNGTFIDGFVYLKSDSAPTLCLPFMGYYGSWNNPEIFEPFVYNKYQIAARIPSIMGDKNFNVAGHNFIASKYLNEEPSYTVPAFSPNGDNVLDNICLYIGYKRRCKKLKAEIYHGKKKVYSETFIPEYGYGELEASYQMYNINWDFADAVEGESYRLRISAETPFSSEGTRTEFLSQDFIIDTTPPVIESCKKLVTNVGGTKTERLFLTLSDNYELQGGLISDGETVTDACGRTGSKTTKSHMLLDIPEDINSSNVEIYDMAGNCTKVGLAELLKNSDTYNLEYDENLYFSTNYSSFAKKIKFTDSYGKDVKYAFSATPKSAYEKNLSEVSISIDNLPLPQITFPVKVGLAGDSDLNDTVDILDAIKIAKYLLWIKNPNGSLKNEFVDFENSLSACLADYNANGTIEILDAVSIAKLLLANKK